MIKHKRLFAKIILIIVFNFGSLYGIQSAVTYDFSGGRLGDCLVSYCHAKWISFLYDIPLLYKPFYYSDAFALHQLEIHYDDHKARQFNHMVILQKNSTIDPDAGILYVVPYFPESIFNRNDDIFPYLFTVDWHNQEFKKILQSMVRPIAPIKTPHIPETMLSVALHIRKGTGWDIPNYRITPAALTASHPLRFAPDSFFIDQLKKIAHLFHDRMIYVYLFTDHNDPNSLAREYQEQVQCDRMMFDYRKDENNEFINVIDDFFALTQFDCLIRADSNFSGMASKLTDYQMIITPWHGIVHGEETIIDEIHFEMKGASCILREKR